MCNTEANVVVTTFQGDEDVYYAEGEDVTFTVDMNAGYLFIGPESELVETEDGYDGLKVAYAPGAWASVAQILD